MISKACSGNSGCRFQIVLSKDLETTDGIGQVPAVWGVHRGNGIGAVNFLTYENRVDAKDLFSVH